MKVIDSPNKRTFEKIKEKDPLKKKDATKDTVEPHFVIVFGIEITHLNAYLLSFVYFMSCRSLFSTR